MFGCLKDWLATRFSTLPAEVVAGPQRSSLRSAADMGVTKLSDSLHDLGSCKEGEEDAVVIFFHGLELNDDVSTDDTYVRTWTYQDNPEECWPPKMFTQDPVLKTSKIRTLAASYDSSKFTTSTSGRFDIYLIGENFAQTIIFDVMKRVPPDRHVPIILVAHSFGGLVVQEMIKHAFDRQRKNHDVKSKDFLTRLDGIFFYSTPHGSLKDDAYEHLFPRSTNAADTTKLLTQHNKYLSRKRENFIKNVRSIISSKDLRNGNEIKIASAFEGAATKVNLKAGPWTGVIALEAAARIGEVILAIPGSDHFNICKPSAGDSGFTQNKYTFLRDFISEILKS